MNGIIRNDYATTELILKISNSLRVNDIVDMLHNEPGEEGDVEFLPVIHVAKNCLERTLRCFVLLSSWAREESVKIRAKSNDKISKTVLEGLRAINVLDINYFNSTKQVDLDNTLNLITALLRIQYFLVKWLTYLHETYHLSIVPTIEFLFKDDIDKL